MKKQFTIDLQDNPEYVSFLRSLTSILEAINNAKGNGLNRVFYQDDRVCSGRGEYTPLIFEALYHVGAKVELEDNRFLGTRLKISWENDNESTYYKTNI